MDLEEVIYKRRTIRRFKQDPISIDILKTLVDYGRVAPAGNNIQSIEFIIISDPKICEQIFPLTAWAGSLPRKQRIPEEGRRPTAYIAVLVNTEIKRVADADEAAAVQNVLLGATSMGIGTCWMGSINRPKLKELLKIPDKYELKHLISLGYPDEESVMETYDGDFKYWKDDTGKMHVPKRSLDDVIFKIL